MSAGGAGSTSEFSLKDVTEADLEIFFENQLDAEANRAGGFTPRDRDAFMAHWAKILGGETVITRTVIFEGRVAGNVMSFVKEGRREVGYWIGREFWGRGVATRALSAFLDHVTERPLTAHAAKQNVASIRVLQKCGFTIVGERVGSDDVEEVILKLEA
jgi:RimJ/RimL family protein N-acetyltransferase